MRVEGCARGGCGLVRVRVCVVGHIGKWVAAARRVSCVGRGDGGDGGDEGGTSERSGDW